MSITIEEMKEEIRKSVNSGEFSPAKIYPAGNGKSIRLFVKGKRIPKDETIRKAYNNILALREGKTLDNTVKEKKKSKAENNNKSKPITKKQSTQKEKQPKPADIEEKKNYTAPDFIQEILNKMKALEDTINGLTEENKALRAEIESIKKQIPGVATKIEEKETILGFTLHLREVGAKEKKYLKWYAYKKHDKKKIWVYVGDKELNEEKLKELAEEKIKAYCEKKGLEKIIAYNEKHNLDLPEQEIFTMKKLGCFTLIIITSVMFLCSIVNNNNIPRPHKPRKQRRHTPTKKRKILKPIKKNKLKKKNNSLENCFKYGLSYEKRQEIFLNFTKEHDKDQISKKYNISTEILKNIALEGIKNNWKKYEKTNKYEKTKKLVIGEKPKITYVKFNYIKEKDCKEASKKWITKYSELEKETAKERTTKKSKPHKKNTEIIYKKCKLCGCGLNLSSYQKKGYCSSCQRLINKRKIIKDGVSIYGKPIFYYKENGKKYYITCLKCGRKLTNKKSQLRGYGPICWKNIGN